MNGYSTGQMRAIWNDREMLERWRLVELAVLLAQTRTDPDIPAAWYDLATGADPVDVDKWQRLTEDTGHELVAFLELWAVQHIHIGVTSSDITDTALGLALKRTNEILTNHAGNLHEALRVKIAEHGHLSRVGRTHGQTAAIMTVGQMLANWDLALDRSMERLDYLRPQVETCMVSGPVGSYLHVRRDTELHTARYLGLHAAESSTQIVMRDGLAAWAGELAIMASLCEAIGVEIRLLQHSQVDEARDRSGSTSSSMAHKNNPNRAERLSGLGRLARAAFEPLAAGIPQWHERDMSHSSVERILIPQLAGITDYALTLTADLIECLEFEPGRTSEIRLDNQVQLLCHSAQTALQKAGVGYVEARKWVSREWIRHVTASGFTEAVLRHPSGPDFEWPTPHTQHLLED